MGSPGRSRSYADRELERSPDKKKGMDVDDDESISNERRKQKLSKSRKSSNEEETDGWDDSGRKKSHSDRNENRRRSGGSSRGDIEEDDYDRRKESGLKQVKRKQGENALEELSNRYQDGELEHKHDVSDKTKTGSHSRIAENDKYSSRKTTSKFSDQEGPQSKSKNEKEKSNDTHHEKETHKDSRYLDRGEGSREKGHGSSEQAKNQRRRDESDAARKSGESYYGGKLDPRRGKESDSRHENSRERSVSAVPENNEGKERVVDATSDKGKSYDREERRADIRSKSGGRSGSKEEDDKVSPQNRGDNSGRDKHEKLREQRSTGHDVVGDRDRLPDPEHDDNARKREDDGRGVHSRRSKTPERSGRHFRENSDVNYERSGSLKRKELEKEGTQDDRAKGRDDSWIDRNRDVEGSRESWKRKQPSSNDRDGDSAHDRDREWEVPRRGRDRIDSERPSGRSGNRKDARSEAVKASSNFGISTENYDVIEIQTKALDPGSTFSGRNEAQQHDSNPSREEWSVPQDDLPMTDAGGPAPPGDDSKGKHLNESTSTYDQNPWRDDTDSQGGKARVPLAGVPSRPSSSQISGDGSQSPYSNHEPGSFGRLSQQGVKGNRIGRGGRVRPPGRDNQPVNVPLPLMGLPFEPLGLPPPGPMQPLNPTMSPAPGLQVPHAAFAPPFSRPLMWPGAGGVDMNMLPVPPSVPPLPPGPAGQRFPPNLGTPSNPAMYFNQPGPGRGVPPMESSPGYNSIIPVGRGPLHDKGSGNWVPPRSSGPPGKAPSRGEQNDYSQNFVDTGMRPQNFIRELELTNVEDYPKLRELIQKKDEIVANSATTPMYYKCDLREFVLSPESFGTKFDVILVDPPWEEYVHRAPGVTDHMDYWTFEEIMNLKIEAIADTPSFIFLWVGDAVGLEQGRQCLKKWGFRRCEDICWVKTNKHTATPALRHDSHTLLQHSKEHCLMGIKGTVRRSTDGHIIHANIDTDVIIAEEPPYGSTAKPDEMYRIIEHFALGRRRIELFGEDHNIRSGWLTVGKGLSSSNFNSEAYVRNFSDKDGKVWQGGGGRNPPPDTPHLVQTTPDIESLRPKSPMKNQQQLQQQSNSISLTTANSSNRRPTVNSPQNPSPFGLNQEASSSNHPPPWASPMVGGAFKGRDLANVGSGENFFDVYGYNMPPPMQTSGEYLEFESQRAMNML